MDTYEGRNGEPMTLHKYLYTHGNPVSNIDPSGNFSLPSLATVSRITTSILLPTLSRSSFAIRTFIGAFQSIAIAMYNRYYLPKIYEEIAALQRTTNDPVKRAAISEALLRVIRVQGEITGKAAKAVVTAQFGGLINGAFLYNAVSSAHEKINSIILNLALVSSIYIDLDIAHFRAGRNLLLLIAQPWDVVTQIGVINQVEENEQQLSAIGRFRIETSLVNIEHELNKYGDATVKYLR